MTSEPPDAADTERFLATPPAELDLSSARTAQLHDAPPSYLVRTGKGRVVRVSPLAFDLLSAARNRVPVETVARNLSRRANRAVTASDVRLWHGQVLAKIDASAAENSPRPDMFAVSLLSAAKTRSIAERLVWLFAPRAVAGLMLSAAVGACVAVAGRGLVMATGMELVPAYLLWLFSVLTHEFGHVGALRRLGGLPGGIGVVLNPFRQTFYSDVTDSWRLSRRGRIAVSLAGVYAQTAVLGCYAFTYAFTGWPPLATALTLGSVSLVTSLFPLARNDGALALADLAGVAEAGRASWKALLTAISPGRQGLDGHSPVLALRGVCVLVVAVTVTVLLVTGHWRPWADLPVSARHAMFGPHVGLRETVTLSLTSLSAAIMTNVIVRTAARVPIRQKQAETPPRPICL